MTAISKTTKIADAEYITKALTTPVNDTMIHNNTSAKSERLKMHQEI